MSDGGGPGTDGAIDVSSESRAMVDPIELRGHVNVEGFVCRGE